MKKTKIIIFWQGISGYMTAAWRELEKIDNLDIYYFITKTAREYDSNLSSSLTNYSEVIIDDTESEAAVINSLNTLEPDIIVLCGWAPKLYRRIVGTGSFNKSKFIMAMDTPWRGDLRQHIAKCFIGSYLKKIDMVVVAGERTGFYAHKLGVPRSRIRMGTYCCDYDLFHNTHTLRNAVTPCPKRFLFVGRLSPVKGIDALLSAYESYRTQVSDPWPLTICGTGPLQSQLNGIPGLDCRGFVQPAELPSIFAESSCFILPSRYEPWGVVIAEACAAGLPVICSDQCCSGIDLVRNYSNGIVFTSDSVDQLTRAMVYMDKNYGSIPTMGRISTQLAKPYSAQAWATRWYQYFSELCPTLIPQW